ncbi:hypothetical protein WBK31_30700 [Nonomuraea sp. N2-4H]|uniref:hypothetical protein n=1 Tax=Nonomuraea sp. N2-4H TaxID=3128898 RepID=UPI00324B5979
MPRSLIVRALASTRSWLSTQNPDEIQVPNAHFGGSEGRQVSRSYRSSTSGGVGPAIT